MSRARTSLSHTAGRKVDTIVCRRWRPTWPAARSPLSPRQQAHRRLWRPKPRPRPSRSSSVSAATRSKRVLSPISTGRVVTSRVTDAELAAKKVGLVHELLPAASHFAVLVNPANLSNELVTRDVQTGAAALGLQIEVLSASTNRDITTAFTTLLQKRAGGLLVSPDPLFVSRHTQFVTLAVRHGVSAIDSFREFAEAGGLMSYGTSNADRDRQVGVYAGRILKGEKPADLPILQPTKFEFVVNLQTARTIGLTVPPTLLARADEVIE